MKIYKLFSLVLAATLVATCFTACGSKEIDGSDSDAPISSSENTEAPKPTQISFDINKFEKKKASVEFVKINGMTDERLQIRLNQNIKDFYTWQWINEDEEDTAKYTATAKYYFKGNLLSVIRILETTAESAAYPISEISAQTYDITTGNIVENILLSGDKVKNAADKFRLIYPDTEVPNAAERFAAYLDDSDTITTCYLTDSGIAVYVPAVSHAEGDYWIFEASYADASEILAPEAAAEIK